MEAIYFDFLDPNYEVVDESEDMHTVDHVAADYDELGDTTVGHEVPNVEHLEVRQDDIEVDHAISDESENTSVDH